MAQHHQTQNANSPNPNLVAAIFIINFVIIGGLIFSNMPQSVSDADDVPIQIVQAEPTATPLPPTATLTVPPTMTPTHVPSSTPVPTQTATSVPSATSTPRSEDTVETVADANAILTNYDPELIASGETLFAQCIACHGLDGRGLPNLGKDLVESEFVISLTDDELVEFIITGRPLWDPDNTTGLDMPGKGGNPALTTEDIEAIVAYIRFLASSSGELAEVQSDGESTSNYDPELIASGETLFAQCIACHGLDGRGLPNLGKDLVESEFVISLTDDELVEFIITGRPLWDPDNTTGLDMPGKGGNPALTTEDIEAIVAYIRSLAG